MKISLENQSRMVLKDYNITEFLTTLLLFIIGVLLIVYIGETNLFAVGFGLLLTVLGLHGFVKTVIVTVVLDKLKNQCSISMKGIMRNESKKFPLSNIKGVTLNTELKTYSGRRGTTAMYQYVLVFVMEDGSELPLEFGTGDPGITDTLITKYDKKKSEAQKVADFLGVEFKFNKPPSLSDILGTIGTAISKIKI